VTRTTDVLPKLQQARDALRFEAATANLNRRAASVFLKEPSEIYRPILPTRPSFAPNLHRTWCATQSNKHSMASRGRCDAKRKGYMFYCQIVRTPAGGGPCRTRFSFLCLHQQRAIGSLPTPLVARSIELPLNRGEGQEIAGQHAPMAPVWTI